MDLAAFTDAVARLLPRPIRGFYLSNVRFLNYAFVCGVLGVLINYAVYHVAALFIWEPAAFYGGVGVAALSNYTLTVGSMKHIFFGLAKEEIGPEL